MLPPLKLLLRQRTSLALTVHVQHGTEIGRGELSLTFENQNSPTVARVQTGEEPYLVVVTAQAFPQTHVSAEEEIHVSQTATLLHASIPVPRALYLLVPSALAKDNRVKVLLAKWNESNDAIDVWFSVPEGNKANLAASMQSAIAYLDIFLSHPSVENAFVPSYLAHGLIAVHMRPLELEDDTVDEWTQYGDYMSAWTPSHHIVSNLRETQAHVSSTLHVYTSGDSAWDLSHTLDLLVIALQRMNTEPSDSTDVEHSKWMHDPSEVTLEAAKIVSTFNNPLQNRHEAMNQYDHFELSLTVATAKHALTRYISLVYPDGRGVLCFAESDVDATLTREEPAASDWALTVKRHTSLLHQSGALELRTFRNTARADAFVVHAAGLAAFPLYAHPLVGGNADFSALVPKAPRSVLQQTIAFELARPSSTLVWHAEAPEPVRRYLRETCQSSSSQDLSVSLRIQPPRINGEEDLTVTFDEADLLKVSQMSAGAVVARVKLDCRLALTGWSLRFRLQAHSDPSLQWHYDFRA
ncbi:MAG: hypothetical protein MHM6MM_005917 [Cercozoa sp. M6MM]